MASIAHLRGEERLGVGIALIAHAALFGLLLWHANRPAAVVPPVERMTVSLAEDVSLESTAPDPATEAPAAVAPVVAPQPEPIPPAVSEPVPRPVEKSVAPPPPKPKATTSPPKPKPSATAAPKTPVRTPAKTPPKPAGGAPTLGDDFLEGAGSSSRADRGTPAATFGPAEQASLAQAINRQLKPHWSAPQGADAEKLVTILAFNLNPDGSLAGSPRVVRQEGITPANEAQASRHAEQAIRAVRLAAPFDLPDEFYDKWKRVTAWRFDRKL